MADRIIQTETLTAIANGLRGGASQSTSDKIEVADFAEVAEGLKADETYLKGIIDKSLTSIVIPEGVTRIAARMFESCVNLTNVTFPSTLTVIDSMAFSGCSSIGSITIPYGVTQINAQAFESCGGLTLVNIPSSISTIRSNAFRNINSDAIINCGFSEGAVSGAPWGAPSTVTINYDV